MSFHANHQLNLNKISLQALNTLSRFRFATFPLDPLSCQKIHLWKQQQIYFIEFYTTDYVGIPLKWYNHWHYLPI